MVQGCLFDLSFKGFRHGAIELSGGFILLCRVFGANLPCGVCCNTKRIYPQLRLKLGLATNIAVAELARPIPVAQIDDTDLRKTIPHFTKESSPGATAIPATEHADSGRLSVDTSACPEGRPLGHRSRHDECAMARRILRPMVIFRPRTG
ncbi:Hypothetical protein AGR8A_Cc40168 [Agrobacterium fabrum str. J-07]|nr:Hypothetical protein AGR8A_Cc40168 [Agrobacterium fabrum str. J-07]